MHRFESGVPDIEGWGSRGTCLDCGSDEVFHVVYGLPADPESAPTWVRFAGCVIDGDPTNRHCDACGHEWLDLPDSRLFEPPPDRLTHPRRKLPKRRRPSHRSRGDVRLLSADGASFALTQVPGHTAGPHITGVDIELLTPDRLVRYLARPLSRTSLQELHGALLRGASDDLPEQTVPTFEDHGAGLAVLFNASTPLSVLVEIRVVSVLGDEVPEQDGVAFDVPRASLIKAAHLLEGWIE